MSRILAVTYGAGHVNMVLPVASVLNRSGHDVSIVALTTAHGPAERAGFHPLGFRDFLRASDVLAHEWGPRLSGGTSPNPDVHPDETSAYLGLNYAELIATRGAEGAARDYAERGRQAFFPIQTVGRIIDEIQPDLVVATSSPRAERAAVTAAAARGIPALVLCDFMPQSELEWLAVPGYGNRLCVMSQGVKQRIVEAGRHDDEIAVTGNPAFDAVFELDAESLRRDWRNRHGFGPDCRVALFASQPDREENLGARAAVRLAEAGRSKGWLVVYRPHPNEQFDHSILPNWIPVSGGGESIWESLCGCDGCLVISSTVGIQALLVGRPMAVYDIPVNADPAPYPAMGLGGYGTTPEAVFDALDAQNRPDGCGMPRRPAAPAVAAEVERLLT